MSLAGDNSDLHAALVPSAAAGQGHAAASAAAWPRTVETPGRVIAADRPSRARIRLEQAASESAVTSWLGRLFRDLPSFLTSAIIHMVLVILLGGWMIQAERTAQPLVLAASLGSEPEDEVQEATTLDEPVEVAPSIADDLAQQVAVADPQPTSASISAKVEEPPPDLFSPAAAMLPSGPSTPGAVLAGRDPRLRGQLLAREGGTSETEAAVAKGLEWIARHQNSDGSWSLHDFQHAGDCDGACGEPGIESDTAGTALALLPFLGSGQTQVRGDYNLPVARGLRWLMDHQKADGDLRGAGGGTMYAHGQATIALCEAYALTRAESLRMPAQKALDFIVAAQHEQGGWRYHPGEAGDLSVVGWQMMALRSGQMASLNVPPKTFAQSNGFLDAVQVSKGVGQYCYMPGGGPTPIMTAEGLLCRQYSGWRYNHPVLNNGVNELLKKHLPRANNVYMYYWYYGTQVMHHMGGRPWQEWNGALRDLLVSLQATTGHEAGSWAPGGGHDRQGGRLYMTALAVCTLEVYYRHMPLYQHAATGGKERERKGAGNRE